METYEQWAARAAQADPAETRAKLEQQREEEETFLTEHPELAAHTLSLRMTVLHCKASGLSIINYSHTEAYGHIYEAAGNVNCRRCAQELEYLRPSDLSFPGRRT